MIGKYTLRCLDPVSLSQHLLRDPVCMLRTPSMLRQEVYNSPLAFTFWMYGASKSARVESLGPSRVFPVHMHSLTHVSGLLDSQEYAKVFQSPPWTAHSPTFPFKVFGQLLACPSYVNNCHWLFSTNALRGKMAVPLSKLQVRFNKHNLSSDVF